MTKEKILITGGSGLVGSRLVELSRSFEIINPSKEDLDITDLASVQKIIEKYTPDWIINFAAYTNVTAAEEQAGDTSGLVWKTNVSGVENLVNSFKSRNIIQLSTDMVFPGTVENPGPYAETDIPGESPANLTWYGWTKNRAEKIIQERGGTILRTIYPVRSTFAGKSDFIREILKKFASGTMYPLFDDQQISIAFVDEIVATLQKIIETDSHGIFHASSDTTTPYELATFIIRELGEDDSLIKSSSINDFLATQKNLNRYPVWGGLKTNITEETLDIHFSTWQTIVEYLIGQGLALPRS